MNTTDIINIVAEETGFTKTDTKKMVHALFQQLANSLKKNEEIRVSGFGTFYPKKREKTQGRNPQTGAPITIPAALQAKFRPSKELKDTMNS